MDLEQHLRVPYLLEAESVERSPGEWVRRASYPEFPGCVAEGDTIVEALDELERIKIRRIVSMLRSGQEPPTPRAPLASAAPDYNLTRLGLSAEVTAGKGSGLR